MVLWNRGGGGGKAASQACQALVYLRFLEKRRFPVIEKAQKGRRGEDS